MKFQCFMWLPCSCKTADVRFGMLSWIIWNFGILPHILYLWCSILLISNYITTPPVVFNGGHGCVPPQGEDPLESRPKLLLWLAASALVTVVERERHLYLWKNCVAQLVGRPDSSDGRALVWFARGPGFDSRAGPVIFPHIFMCIIQFK